MKKTLSLIVALALAVVLMLSLVACGDGTDGANGNGIESIAKTSTEGVVDTYTITFTDGTTTQFTVINGKDGKNGQSGVNGQNGEKGTDGKDGADGAPGKDGKDGNGIESVEKTSSDGKTDTYTVTFTDGKTTTFTVTNGTDGSNGQDG
ncbi:MAG: collagen-like protein, partial [Clostridia bacterium]|nr:collagen-like protein [Clostridia bacterium]